VETPPPGLPPEVKEQQAAETPPGDAASDSES